VLRKVRLETDGSAGCRKFEIDNSKSILMLLGNSYDTRVLLESWLYQTSY